MTVWQAVQYMQQIWYTLGGTEIFIRQMVGGVWQPWVKTYPASGGMTLIQEVVLAANGYFNFPTIPQTYKHLKIYADLRG